MALGTVAICQVADRVGLHTVNPRRAQIDSGPEGTICPDPPADALTCFHNDDGESTIRQTTCRGQSPDPCADNDDRLSNFSGGSLRRTAQTARRARPKHRQGGEQRSASLRPTRGSSDAKIESGFTR